MNGRIRIERLVLTDPTDPRIPRHATALGRISAQSDLSVIVTFCAVGLLISAALLVVLPLTADLADALQRGM
jgi:hypothetical protein